MPYIFHLSDLTTISKFLKLIFILNNIWACLLYYIYGFEYFVMIFYCFKLWIYEKDDSILIENLKLPRADCNLSDFFDLCVHERKLFRYFRCTIIIVPVKLSCLGENVEKEIKQPVDMFWQTLSFSLQQVMYNWIRNRTGDGLYSLTT